MNASEMRKMIIPTYKNKIENTVIDTEAINKIEGKYKVYKEKQVQLKIEIESYEEYLNNLKLTEARRYDSLLDDLDKVNEYENIINRKVNEFQQVEENKIKESENHIAGLKQNIIEVEEESEQMQNDSN